jgi:large subunit ribosomal protein L24
MNKKNKSIKNLRIKKSDTVKVISGADKNQTGEVLRVYTKDRKALVKGVNMVTKHKKPDADNPNGSIVKIEAPVHISNIMLVLDGESTRVGRKLNDDGKLQRYSKKSGEFIK